MKVSEGAPSKERYIRTSLSALLVVSIGLTACGEEEKDEKRCLSPAAVSGLYRGDRTEGVTGKQTTWRLGVVITDETVIRDAGAYRGMVIGFGTTPGNTDGLDELPPIGYPFGDPHLSRPVPPQHKQYMVKIGPGDTTFTARLQAVAGSPDCQQPPDVNFGTAKPLTEILPPGSPGPVSPDWP
jgi:hypothetical protein